MGDWVVLALPILRRSLAWNIWEAVFYGVVCGFNLRGHCGLDPQSVGAMTWWEINCEVAGQARNDVVGDKL